MRICNLCPRKCGIDREKRVGFCRVGEKSYVARAALHMWEEPFISGKEGSGTIFFCGCNLRCIFCQNHEISTRGNSPKAISVDSQKLSDIMLHLQNIGANNINFVTPTPHIPLISESIPLAREKGLSVPVAFNTNSYVTVDSLKMLDSLVDIYMPDFKYVTPALAKLISAAEDYPESALSAIKEMFRQVGRLTFDERGMSKKGMIIRHLVLPGNVDETRRVLDCIADNFPLDIHISLMSQYFPTHNAEKIPSLNRLLLPREYRRAVDYACSLGFTNVLTQEMSAASESYVPSFEMSDF